MQSTLGRFGIAKRFRIATGRLVRERSPDGQDDPRRHCTICGELFGTAQALGSHMRYVHGQSRADLEELDEPNAVWRLLQVCSCSGREILNCRPQLCGLSQILNRMTQFEIPRP